MSMYILRRFTNVETLKLIEWRHLRAILERARAYFESHGLEIPSLESGRTVDHAALLALLQSPDEDMPADVAEAFLFIDQLSSCEDAEAVLAIAQQAGLEIQTLGQTEQDIVAQVWLRDPELLRHARGHLSICHRRRLVTFQGAAPSGNGFALPAAEALRALERDLDVRYAANGRGRGARVHVFERRGEISIAIRHGGSLEHDWAIRDGHTQMLLYRPERYDLAIYRPALDELAINAETEGGEAFYREVLGRHLLGSPEHFRGEDKYTLEPLRLHGERALHWHDVEGIEWAKLHEFAYSWNSYGDETISRRSRDILEMLRGRGKNIHKKAKLIRATFLVKLKGVRKARVVTIRGPNLAEFTQDAHAAVIERWLARREFVKARAA